MSTDIISPDGNSCNRNQKIKAVIIKRRQTAHHFPPHPFDLRLLKKHSTATPIPY
jgi:hypothetical protein